MVNPIFELIVVSVKLISKSYTYFRFNLMCGMINKCIFIVKSLFWKHWTSIYERMVKNLYGFFFRYCISSFKLFTSHVDKHWAQSTLLSSF